MLEDLTLSLTTDILEDLIGGPATHPDQYLFQDGAFFHFQDGTLYLFN